MSATIPLFRNGHWYDSRDTTAVSATVRLGLAPEIMCRDELRRTSAPRPPIDPERRRAIVGRAAELFRTGRLDLGSFGTQDPEQFTALMSEVAGLPASLVERWTTMLTTALDELTISPPDDAATLVWLPGNTFTCLVAVGEAVLRGGHVLVRPSRAEPVSAVRFVAALLAAGWPADRISFLPTPIEALPIFVGKTQRQIVYGGADVAAALPAARPGLDLRGPGRGCAVVGTGLGPVDRLAALVADDAGRFCSNVRTIACLGDPEPLAARLAEALDAVPLDTIAGATPDAAASYAGLIERRLGPRDRRRTRRPIVTTAGGRTILAPTLVQLDHAPDHPLIGFEVPFPFASIVAVDPAGAAAITARSLYVHDLTDRREMER
jgi:hypothetical protein